MTERYMKAQEDRQFEAAFAASEFSVKPTAQRVWEPKAPLVPWYLDKDSGGPNPTVKEPGIAYESDFS
ncbi:MAG: hypothetical protein JNM99_10080 [Verrucomicrobiaceae bacterium]|nr:hypothetical protein [Verrucomicrobiaceae bacterium]